MADQTSHKEKDEVDLLVNLKRLTVDLECSKSVVDVEPTSLNTLWSGNSAEAKLDSKQWSDREQRSRGAEDRRLKTKTSLMEKVRVEPYSLDCLRSLRRLCLSQEACSRPQCSCKRKRPEESASSSSQSTLNLVHAAAACQRKILQEARFQIDKSPKERRTILHAARLKLKQSSSEPAAPAPDARDDAPKVEAPRLLSSDRLSAGDFASLASSAGSSGTSSSDVERKWTATPFQQYRGASPELPQPFPSRPSPRQKPEDVVSVRLKKQASLVPPCDGPSEAVTEEPLQPAEKRQCTESVKQGTSCSQEARLDDLSVNELASYFEVFIHIPKKMSYMAEMMYA